MKRTHSSENRPLMWQITKTQETPPRASISNQENPPRMYQREAMQVSELGAGIVNNSQSVLNSPVNQLISANRSSIRPTLLSVGIVGHSQSVLNPPVNQFAVTNIRLISPTLNTINQPRLTPQILPVAIEAISNDDLETAMQIVGVKSIEELAYSTDGKGNTLLARAAEHGHLKPIKVLLSKVLDPQKLTQIKNNVGQTALLLAAENGHANVITALLKGVSNRQQLAEQSDAQGNSALHYAALYGHAAANTAILSDVINADKLAEQQNNFGYSALMLAADKGHVEVIISIFRGVNNRQQLAEQINNFGQTVLMNAVLFGASSMIITKILESVEDAEKLIFQVDNQGLNSFSFALKRGNTEAALVLFDWAKDKTSLLLKTNNPNQVAAIQMMKPEIQDVFIKKINEPKE